MSLLTVCQNVASEVGTYGAPTSVISNTSDDVVKLLALANRTGREIMGAHDWQRLQTETTITTVDTTEGYDLLSDYDRVINNTMWDNTNNRQMKLVTPQQWAYFKNGIVAQSGIQRWWRQRGNQILIYPTPSNTNTIKYEYISNKYVVNSAGDTTYATFQADTDTTLFPENLLELGMIYRQKKQIGLAAADDKNTYEMELRSEIARDGGNAIIAPYYPHYPYVNIQDSNFPSS